MSSAVTFNLLQVDDDDNERLLLRHAVIRTRLPIRLVAARSGIEALALLSQQPADSQFDLMLLDIRMPMMSGFELLQELQRSDRRNFPVMIMSNSSEPADVQRASQLGAVGYLAKPGS